MAISRRGRAPADGRQPSRSLVAAAVAGASVGVLGGLIGLGGAEFRLPLLIAVFSFAALQAVVLNKVMSLVVVVTAVPARLGAVPVSALSAQGHVVVQLLAGSLLGAWAGAAWATRMRSATLHRVLAALLVLIAAALALDHYGLVQPLVLGTTARVLASVAAGAAIGVVAALLGVAGGELLIPTIVLLHGVEPKVAGSLSLLVSLPTMLVALARYRRDGSTAVLRRAAPFALAMAGGSVAGTVTGGLLVGVVPTAVLVPVLVTLLLASSVTVWRDR